MALNLMSNLDGLAAFLRKDFRELLNVTIDVYSWTQGKPVRAKTLLEHYRYLRHLRWKLTCKMHRPSICRPGNLDQHKVDRGTPQWLAAGISLDELDILDHLPDPSRTSTLHRVSWNNRQFLWVVPEVSLILRHPKHPVGRKELRRMMTAYRVYLVVVAKGRVPIQIWKRKRIDRFFLTVGIPEVLEVCLVPAEISFWENREV